MKVLFVVSECYPLIKTGGLADVAGSLPVALTDLDVDCRVLLPSYPDVMEKLNKVDEVCAYESLFGFKARILKAELGKLKLFILDVPELFSRPGNPYLDSQGLDWSDNWKRFAALSRVGADIAAGVIPQFKPELVHCHDWQAGLTPAYMNFGGANKTKTVMTIHNLAYQGKFSSEIFPKLELPPEANSVNGIEYYGAVGFLKSGIWYSNAVTTVSPTYAEEIMTPEFGMGFDGLLTQKRNSFYGIINGIDTEAWNPRYDKYIRKNYGLTALYQRGWNKRDIMEKFDLDHDDGPIIGIISRMSWQKGLDILFESLDELINMGYRIVILGQGDMFLENMFRQAKKRHKGKFGVMFGYSEETAHIIQGGADMVMVPSRFEPCGLTQLFGLRYGCVPLVSNSGGLADTVIDTNMASIISNCSTGFRFEPGSGKELVNACRRALKVYRDKTVWKIIQKNGMRTDVSWNKSAELYLELYKKILSE